MALSRRSLFGLALGALAAPFVPARPPQWQWGYVGKLGFTPWLGVSPTLHSALVGEAGGTRYVPTLAEMQAHVDGFTARMAETQQEADRRFAALEARIDKTQERFRQAFASDDKATHRIARLHAAEAAQGTFAAVRKAMPGILA